MKKLFYAIAVTAMTVLVAGCAREMETTVAQKGDTVKATFTVQLPQSVVTKATSETSNGLKADELLFFAYDKNGNHLDLDKTAAVSGKQATLEVDLIAGIQYQFVFWAQKADQYTDMINAATGVLTLDPADMMNSDDWDAFTAFKVMTVNGAFNETVTLTRPFAQLNVGAPKTDFQAAGKSGIAVDGTLKTAYKVMAPSTLNLLSQEAGDAAEVTMTAVSHIIDGDLTVSDVNYDYAAMAYILAPADDKALTDVTISIETTQNNEAIALTREVANVPLQRNYRTNILGNIFTVKGTFQIVVDNNFNDPDNNTDMPVTVASVTEANNAMVDNKAEETQAYQIPEVTTDDTEIIIPTGTTSETITLNIDDIADGVNEIVVRDETPDTATGRYANDIIIVIPEGVTVPTITVNAPSAHVELQQGSYTEVISSTSNGTLVIGEGVVVEKLTINKGYVRVLAGGTLCGDDNITVNVAANLYIEEGANCDATTHTDANTGKKLTVYRYVSELPVTPSVCSYLINKPVTEDLVINEGFIVNATADCPLVMNGANILIKNGGTLSATVANITNNNDGKLSIYAELGASCIPSGNLAKNIEVTAEVSKLPNSPSAVNYILMSDYTGVRNTFGVLASGKAVYDLNGHTFTVTDEGYWAVETRGSVSFDIKGGKVVAPASYGLWCGSASSEINVLSGEFEADTHVLYAYAGTINVYGGSFKLLSNPDLDVNGHEKFVLNCYDANYTAGTAKINVYGGKFYNFNPAESYSEPNGPVSFVAAGYHVEQSIEEGVDVFTVVAD